RRPRTTRPGNSVKQQSGPFASSAPPALKPSITYDITVAALRTSVFGAGHRFCDRNPPPSSPPRARLLPREVNISGIENVRVVTIQPDERGALDPRQMQSTTRGILCWSTLSCFQSALRLEAVTEPADDTEAHNASYGTDI